MTDSTTAAGRSAGAVPPLKALSLEQIAAGLDGGAFTVADLARAHLDQIAEFNPVLRAVIQVNPKAVWIAEDLDRELKQRGRRG